MKTRLKNSFVLPMLMTGAGLMLAGPVTAQTLTTLYSFTGGDDGVSPQSTLILSGNTLYGTTTGGGSGAAGTVFKVDTDGTGFMTLYPFTGGDDGAGPQTGLVLASNMVYGVAAFGGTGGKGTVFGVNTNGGGFTNLHSFTGGNDGATPVGSLILSGNTLYGTTTQGGGATVGTIFAVNTDGTGFNTVYTFTASNDGATPYCGLYLVGDTLYGTTIQGGNGTVFKVKTDGTGLVPLYTFSGGSDGGAPYAGVVLSGNTLYGTTHGNGGSGFGTVFAVKTNALGFTNLHDFTGGTNGGAPYAGLIVSGGTLYGTTYEGPFIGNGTIFQISTNGTGFTNLYVFSGGSDGGNPYGGLLLSSNTLYGTTFYGGDAGHGAVFSLSLGAVSRPQLVIARAGANVILTWPTNAAGFTLQSTTNLATPPVWGTVSPGPVVVNGQNTVTNAIAGSRRFYRLSQ